MSGQTVPNNDPSGVAPTPVPVSGAPTRARLTLSLSAPATAFTEATVYATRPGYTNVSQQVIYDPLLVMSLQAGQQSIAQDLRFGAPYNSFEAVLNSIGRGNTVAATLTMVV